MAELDLNSLRLFYQVVNAESITRASEQLRIPKSTLSRKLSQLEQYMGTVLLKKVKKGTRRLVLTEIGSVLYGHCERIVAEVEQAGLETQDLQSEIRGPLRVSIPVDFGISWIGRVLAEFSRRYPEVNLEVEVNSRQVTPREDPYDLTIQLGPLNSSGLIYRRLARLHRALYVNPDYLADTGMPRTVQELQQHRCIVTDQQRRDGVWTFRNPAGQRFIELQGHVVVNNIGIARELAVGGVGIAMLPSLLCEGDLRTGRLVRVLQDWESPPLDTTALVLSRKGIPKKTRIFLDFISERLQLRVAETDEAT